MTTLRSPLPLQIAYAICLVIGSCTHASILIRHGLTWTYDGSPPAAVIFWDALAILDPLVAVLVFTHRRLGCALLVALMAADVTLNIWLASFRPMVVWQIVDQGVFLVFILATVRYVWRGSLCLLPSM